MLVSKAAASMRVVYKCTMAADCIHSTYLSYGKRPLLARLGREVYSGSVGVRGPLCKSEHS